MVSTVLKKDYLKFFRMMFYFYLGLTFITLLTLIWGGFFGQIPLLVIRLNQYSIPLFVFLKILWMVFIYFTFDAIKPYIKKYDFKYFKKVTMLVLILSFLSYLTFILTRGQANEILFSTLYLTAINLEIITQVVLFLLLIFGYVKYFKPLLKDKLNPLVIIISVGMVTVYDLLLFLGLINTMTLFEIFSPILIFFAYFALKNSLYKISEY